MAAGVAGVLRELRALRVDLAAMGDDRTHRLSSTERLEVLARLRDLHELVAGDDVLVAMIEREERQLADGVLDA